MVEWLADRLRSITICAYVLIILGAIFIVISLLCLTGVAYLIVSTIRPTLDSFLASFETIGLPQLVNLLTGPQMFTLYGFIFLFFGGSLAIGAIGLLSGSDWGRILTVFNGIILIILIITLPLGILIVWYFRKDTIRNEFLD